ncbi:MAG: hypothetical protein DRJ40_01295 [Thermoprotei archaeon]|nr:MAG: hypothetical protein DRJ40_01295 [Thermoprotei archaeon]
MVEEISGVAFGTYDINHVVPIAFALRSKTRRSILSTLYLRGELSPIEIARSIGVAPTSLVEHLKMLRELGLVEEASLLRAPYRKVIRLNIPVVKLDVLEKVKKEMKDVVASFVSAILEELRSNIALSGLSEVEVRALCLALICSVAGEVLGIDTALIHF